VHDPLCFHCQQAAEKYLKAVLSESGVPIPRTHDLGVLLGLAQPKLPNLLSLRRALNLLTQFAVEYRYPGLHASARQARSALRHATSVREDLRCAMGLPARQ
jgi:HEPN domain-containing protein